MGHGPAGLCPRRRRTGARLPGHGSGITARKAFASMIEAADYCIVVVHPDEATEATAGMLLLVPRSAAGRRVDKVWDTLGMRATRSDALILEDCWVPEEALLLRSDD